MNDICMHNVIHIYIDIASFYDEALFSKERINDIDMHDFFFLLANVGPPTRHVGRPIRTSTDLNR